MFNINPNESDSVKGNDLTAGIGTPLSQRKESAPHSGDEIVMIDTCMRLDQPAKPIQENEAK